MTTIEDIKGHIDILKYVKQQQAMTGGTVPAMVSVSVRLRL
jgi:hypothetical protein